MVALGALARVILVIFDALVLHGTEEAELLREDCLLGFAFSWLSVSSGREIIGRVNEIKESHSGHSALAHRI